MLDGQLLVDAHTHVARLSTLSADWQAWVRTFGDGIPLGDLFDRDGAPRPDAIDDHFARQGADHVLLFSEYSPKATGVQPIEDVLPLVEFNPARFRPVANINPHLHYPPAKELARQVGLGAVALKVHPVHGGFEARDRMLPRNGTCRSSCTAARRPSPGRSTATPTPGCSMKSSATFPA